MSINTGASDGYALRSSSEPRMPHEIFGTIFEMVEDEAELCGMRLVSQLFEDLIVPILYRKVTITERIVNAYDRSVLVPVGAATAVHHLPFNLKMARFTKHVTVDRELPFESLHKMLVDLEKIETITLSHWSPNTSSSRGLTPEQIDPNAALILRRAHANPIPKLLIEGLSLGSPQSVWLQISPPRNLVSFKVKHWSTWDIPGIKRVLIDQPGLKTIHLGKPWREPTWPPDRGERGISPGDRLPGIEELVLENYYWNHTAVTAVNFWNWTKIRRLELKDISIMLFMETVPPEHLVQLKHLVLSASPYNNCMAMLHKEMSPYLDKVPALETLKISCDPIRFLEAALKHGTTLRSLELLNHDVLRNRYRRVFSVGQVKAINAKCPKLMELGVEAYSRDDAAPADAVRINSPIFSNMRNLRRLTLYAYDVTPEWGPLDDLSDKELAGQLDLSIRGRLLSLVHAKQGVRFEWICVLMMVAHGTYRRVRMQVKWKYEDGKGLGRPVVGL